jgi:hypothetical protein
MKLTQKQLKRIIKEEIDNLQNQPGDEPAEEPTWREIYNQAVAWYSAAPASGDMAKTWMKSSEWARQMKSHVKTIRNNWWFEPEGFGDDAEIDRDGSKIIALMAAARIPELQQKIEDYNN